MQLYTMHDKAMDTYGPPMAFATDAVAVRALQDEMQNPESMFRKHPDDFVIYRIGTWDDANGQVINYTRDRVIAISALMEPKQ